jgi:hypothetical protein
MTKLDKQRRRIAHRLLAAWDYGEEWMYVGNDDWIVGHDGDNMWTKIRLMTADEFCKDNLNETTLVVTFWPNSTAVVSALASAPRPVPASSGAGS